MRSDASARAWMAVLDNARLARTFIDGETLDSFRQDRKTFYAVTRCLEIISEAARRIDESDRLRHPNLPWRQIMDSGNVFRHRYDHVGEAQVWLTVAERLLELIHAAEAELGVQAERSHGIE